MRPDIAFITFNHVPSINLSFKYDRLGPMAIENHRAYCERHGYDFIDAAYVALDRPAAWAKIPAILKVLADYRWVVWADSDALIFRGEADLRQFCDARFDIIAQCPMAYLEPLGWTTKYSIEAMQFNTGVFMVRNSQWSHRLLEKAYAQEQFVTHGELWSGIGDQEAIQEVLRSKPADLDRIRYVDNLQCHPKCRSSEHIFVHFYGNHARHCISESDSLDVIRRWERSVRQGAELPSDLARFHWACIQNKSPVGQFDRGGPERFFYTAAEIGLQ